MGIEQMAAYVKEKSGGKFKIRIAYGSALSKPKENWTARSALSRWRAVRPTIRPTPTLSGLDLPFLPIANFDTQRVSEAYYAHPAVVADGQMGRHVRHVDPAAVRVHGQRHPAKIHERLEWQTGPCPRRNG